MPMDSSAPTGPATPAAPKGLFNALLTSLPIALTILATAFAGLSSSEMTQSMYYRSLAAQHQSKAGDQWAFFQAKRIRNTNLETSVELLQSLASPEPFDLERVDEMAAAVVPLLESAGQPKGGGDD